MNSREGAGFRRVSCRGTEGVPGFTLSSPLSLQGEGGQGDKGEGLTQAARAKGKERRVVSLEGEGESLLIPKSFSRVYS